MLKLRDCRPISSGSLLPALSQCSQLTRICYDNSSKVLKHCSTLPTNQLTKELCTAPKEAYNCFGYNKVAQYLENSSNLRIILQHCKAVQNQSTLVAMTVMTVMSINWRPLCWLNSFWVLRNEMHKTGFSSKGPHYTGFGHCSVWWRQNWAKWGQNMGADWWAHWGREVKCLVESESFMSPDVALVRTGSSETCSHLSSNGQILRTWFSVVCF